MKYAMVLLLGIFCGCESVPSTVIPTRQKTSPGTRLRSSSMPVMTQTSLDSTLDVDLTMVDAARGMLDLDPPSDTIMVSPDFMSTTDFTPAPDLSPPADLTPSPDLTTVDFRMCTGVCYPGITRSCGYAGWCGVSHLRQHMPVGFVCRRCLSVRIA